MKYEITSDKSTPVERKLEVSVHSESLTEIWREELEKIKREVEVPGFRLGKAPMSIVEGRVGRIKIWEAVQETAKSRVIQEIVGQAEVKPLTPPKAEVVEEGDEDDSDYLDKPLNIKVTYFLPPPTPEEIERDLARRGKSLSPEHISPKDTVNPATGLPPDPRSVVPGAGIPPSPFSDSRPPETDVIMPPNESEDEFPED